MPNKKISQLDQITSVAGTEVVPVVQGGVVKRTTTGAFTGRLKELARAANATAIQDAKEVGRSTLIDGLSAGAVMQQDLSAVSAALHRSPNAVTAMFVYDTSKDSDGGAWTKRCQHTSWYNEPLNGKWLGAQTSELNARFENVILGPQLISNGSFDSGIASWTSNRLAVLSYTSNALKIAYGGDTAFSASTGFTTTVNKQYKISVELKDISNASVPRIEVNTSGMPLQGSNIITLGLTSPGTYTGIFTSTQADLYLYLIGGNNPSSYITIDNVVIKEVVTNNTQSGNYYQDSTNGKFYRLWKNLIKYSEQFDNSSWAKTNLSVISNAVTAPDNTLTADALIENNVNGYHHIDSSTAPVSTGYNSISVYLKANGKTQPVVQFKGVANEGYAVYNLTAVTATATNATASIESVGNGWYLCKLTVLATSSGTGYIRVFLDNSQYQGNGTSGVYIWGAQLEYSSSATTYEAKLADGSTSEVFRGNKAEFPSLVGIVAEAGSVTLYDLTEAGMPMWMRFLSTAANSLTARALMGNNNVNALSASSGLLVIGNLTNSGYQGSVISMHGDTSRYIVSSGSYMFDGGLSERNIRKLSANGGGYTINSTSINSIATATLADAPVDSNSGLRAVTVAVATSGGISLIKNGTTVYNSTQTLSFDRVYLTPKMLIASRTGDSTLYYYPNPANISANFTLLTEASGAVDFNQGNTTALALENRSEFARSSGAKLQLLKHNETTAAKGAAATITPTYNTGYMVGDIKRSYLTSVAPGTVTSTAFAARSLFLDDTTKGIWLDPSDLGTMFQDTAATIPVTGVEQQVRLILDKSKGLALGPELIDNGNFSTSNLSAWSTYNTSISVVDGEMLVNVTGSNAKVWRTITCVVGKTYKITAKARPQNGAQVWLYIGSSTEQTEDFNSGQGTTSRTISAIFTAGRVTEYITLRSQATGQVYWDDISVKELPGNHATAPSDAARPTLSARYNLLTKTEDFSDAAWGSNAATIGTNTTIAPDGTQTADTITVSSGTGNMIATGVANAAGSYTAEISIAKSSNNFFFFYVSDTGTNYASVWVDLSTMQLGTVAATGSFSAASATITQQENGFKRLRLNFTKPTTSSSHFGFSPATADNSFNRVTGQNVIAWGASLVPADQAGLPYQRVNTGTDYDSDATKFPRYLKFSGAQSLQTNSIDFSYTDKMFVSAGVRKIGSSSSIAVEFGPNVGVIDSTFAFYAPGESTNYYLFWTRGTSNAYGVDSRAVVVSPVTNVISGQSSIAGASSFARIRTNGVQTGEDTTNQGVVTYGNYPLYIGARVGTSLFFNGQLSQLLIAGRAVTDKQIQDAENYIEQKTYGTYPEFLVDASGNQVVDALGNPLYANVTYQY